MPHPILNLDDVKLLDWGHGGAATPGLGEAPERFQARMGEIGGRLGSRQLGYMLTITPPGKAAFPRHSHRANEEMFFILEGQGEVLIGEARHPIRAGDVICCPAGGPETAHQIVNTGQADLKYLGVSTLISPEFVDYPDSGKFGVSIYEDGEVPDGRRPRRFRQLVRRSEEQPDYWEGE